MSVGEKAVRGVAWNMITGVGARAVGLVGTLLLTRFVAPEEYGEVSAAAICVGTGMMFANLSLGQYIIAKKAKPDESYHALVFHVMLGALALAIVYVLRDRLGLIFDAPKMGRYIPGFALAALLERIGYVPERTLVRDLRFREVAVARGLGELVYTSVALGCAPWLGGMGIVWGNIARSVQANAMLIRSSHREDWLKPAPLQRGIFVRLFGYCWPFAINSLSEYAAGKWDNLLVSRYFGPDLMGQYNLAYNLADTPTGSVAEHIGDVLLPSFAQLELEHRKRALLRSAGIMALLVFPLAAGLGAVAPTLVRTFFDKRWLDVAPMLAILSMLSIVRPLSWPLGNFLQAQQRPRLIMFLGLLKIFFILSTIFAFGRHGALWTCSAVGAAFTLHTLITLVVVGYTDGVPVMGYLLGVTGPLVACGVMVAAVIGQRQLLRHVGIEAGWTSLVAEIGVGGIVYVLAAFVVARPICDDVINQIKRILNRRKG